MASFGFVTGCHAGDKFMVQATLASIKHYCPNVPVCLVVDGDFDVSDLVREYGIIVLRISDLPSPEMRKLCSGNTQAKFAAMWAGPFEHFVWLDADAIVWGDFTSQVRPDLDFQIFWNEISIPPDAAEPPDWLSLFYFYPEKIKRFDPDFEWRGLAYFCDGAFASRRNVFTFEQWLEIVNWRQPEPPWTKRRSFNTVPKINYLIHALAQRGKLKVDFTDLQHIWSCHGTAELERDCAGAGWRFPQHIQRPRVAHFCGKKPLLYNRSAYSRPFTIARMEHHRRQHGEARAWISLLNEDRQSLQGKVKKWIDRRLPGDRQAKKLVGSPGGR